jgi:hypothetical protein
LLLALSLARELRLEPAWLGGLLARAVVLGLGFVRHEHRAAAPMLDLAVFARREFAAGIASGLLSYLVLFVTPFFLEGGLHLGLPRPGWC